MNLDYIFTAHIKVDTPIEIGDIGKGVRRIIPIVGGSFDGPLLRGSILTGGADYQVIRYDGTTEALAHYTIVTEDDVPIYVVNKGYRHGPKEIIDKIIKGEEVPDRSYYFKTTPVFETGSKKYDFLNKMIFVGKGIRRPSEVEIRFYQLV